MSGRKKYDKFFLGIVLILLVFGFFSFSSASLGLAAKNYKHYYFPILKQVFLGGGVGIIFLLITTKINYKKWKKIALPFFLFAILVNLLVFIPWLGIEHGGAKRWISVNGFSFQPSELLKFAFIVYLASWLTARKKEIASFKNGLIPFLVIVSFVGLVLVLQSDIGTLGVISITAGFLFFLSGGRFSQIGFLILLGIASLLILAALEPYRLSRILVFLNNSYDIQGVGYQLRQSKIALGSGGIFGKGFGQGISKFNFLPEPTGDSIFAVIGEEFGFIGTISLVILFLMFFYRGTTIAIRAPDIYGRLLGAGLVILITTQAFINMCAMVGLVPLTGLPLTFISQGGSALAIALGESGVILNISKFN